MDFIACRNIILILIFNVILMLPFNCYSERAPNYSFVKEATLAPQISHFDYIVIGGGTSGCALTATLSNGAHVLLLERGGSPYGNSDVEYVVGFGSNLDDTSLSAAAQPFVSEDGVVNARPRILGGGSAVNAGFYTRASPDYVKQAGWDPNSVDESYKWVEKKVAFKPPMLGFQNAFKDGLIEVGVLPYNGFTYNHIYGTKIGGTIFDANGKRHTAADLLEYAIPNRTNVYLFATVYKILFTTRGEYSKKPRAYGVIFKDTKGVKRTAYLKSGPKNEIILSAGAIGSPQMLMLSGIGPKAHLKKLGINVVVNGPMVGQGMADNPMNAVMIPSPIPVEVSLIQAVGITHFGCYIEAASSTNFANAILHSLPTTSLSTAYKTESTLESDAFYASLILEKTMGPKSRGHLFLKTNNPQDNPSVTFNYFKEEEDLNRCIKGMELVIKIIQSKSLSKFRDPESKIEDLLTTMLNLPLNQVPKGYNDTEFSTLGQFCKDTVMTIWHYHGGCQVGRVVDEDYKVYNVSGLRVIDGSTFLNSPGTNPQATVMMLGRYMGQRILEERAATSPGSK